MLSHSLSHSLSRSLLENGAVMGWNMTKGSFYHNRAVLFQDNMRLQWINQLFVDDGYLWIVSNRCDQVNLEVRYFLISNASGFTSSLGPSFKKTRLTFEYSACVSKSVVPKAT